MCILICLLGNILQVSDLSYVFFIFFFFSVHQTGWYQLTYLYIY